MCNFLDCDDKSIVYPSKTIDKDDVQEKKKEFYEENKEKIKEHAEEYMEENKEVLPGIIAEYRKNYAEKIMIESLKNIKNIIKKTRRK